MPGFRLRWSLDPGMPQGVFGAALGRAPPRRRGGRPPSVKAQPSPPFPPQRMPFPLSDTQRHSGECGRLYMATAPTKFALVGPGRDALGGGAVTPPPPSPGRPAYAQPLPP